jgi:hypothetical protein
MGTDGTPQPRASVLASRRPYITDPLPLFMFVGKDGATYNDSFVVTCDAFASLL